MKSVVKVRRGSSNTRYVVIPKELQSRIVAKFMAADVDEEGNLVYKPIPEV